MIEYTITVSGEKKKLPIMEFSDKQYDLIGEMLLAERSFLSKIKKFLNNDNEAEFSGNVFCISKNDSLIHIENEVNDCEISVTQDEFSNLLNAYYSEYKKLKKKK